MAKKGRKRKIVLAALVLMLAALPIWLPWVARPILGRYGIHYAAYKRATYSRFELTDVIYNSKNVKVTSGHVEALLPTAWLWQRTMNRREPAVCLRAQNWKVEITGGEAAPRRTPSSTYTIFHNVESIWAVLRSWVPNVVLTNGVVQVYDQTFRVPDAVWVQGDLSADIEYAKYQQQARLHAQLATAPYEISFHSSSLQLDSVTHFSKEVNGLALHSTNYWLGNPIEANAQFSRQGFSPEQATVRAASLRIPAGMLGLKDFEDLIGSFMFEWRQNEFALDVLASARPDTRNLSPIEVQVHSRGNAKSAVIETAKISSPWLLADLTPATEIKFARPFLPEEAVLNIALDLGQQPWLAADGTLDGQVVLCPAWERFPAAYFAFSGADLGASAVCIKAAALKGNFVWPWLDISQLDLDLADGSAASLRGRLDVAQRIVRDGHLRCDGTFGREFLPSGYSFERGSVDVNFSGPLKTPLHSGQLEAHDFIGPALHPWQLRADWEGEGLRLPRSEFTVTAGKSSLEFQGSFAATNRELNVLMNTLTLEQNHQLILALERPSQLSLRRAANRLNAQPAVLAGKLEAFHWLGANREIRLDAECEWPREGKLGAAFRSIDSSLFADFLTLPPPVIRIEALNLLADWNNGPAHVSLELSAVSTNQGIPFSAEAKLKGDSQGAAVEKLAVTSLDKTVFNLHGFVPLTITPAGPKEHLNFLSGPPLQLQAVSEPNSPFWEQFTAATGIVLAEPHLNVNVSGGWNTLRGSVEMRVKQVKLNSGRFRKEDRSPEKAVPVPAPTTNGPLNLENVQIAIELEREIARVNELSLRIEGQPLTASGEVPLGQKFWSGLEHRKALIDWERATLRLKVQDAQLAPLARFAPNVLRPQGTLNMSLTMLPGGKLDGQLKVSGASTLPLGNLGVIRDIEAEFKFLDRVIASKTITASVGGAPVRATATADMRGTEWLKGELPPLRVTLRGDNVPLARSPDFILRSDLDLTVTNRPGAPAMVAGLAHLRNSFYLRDLKDLIPGGVATPSSRPPYFSIGTKPLADWRLDLNVTSEPGFLKVNSPVFRGKVSADLKLTGTLKDPVALGISKIDSGVVQFPFGNLEVTQGFVTLSSENPYRPELLVTATSRRAGYDVKMEVSGPADQPVVQFSSTPPLGSEQIVLMLATGEIPHSEFSPTPQQRASRLALFLGKNLLSQFGLGGDSERLSVRSGESISETGKTTYDVEYKLSRRWYLVGEYDRFNAFNFGLRWKIYSK